MQDVASQRNRGVEEDPWHDGRQWLMISDFFTASHTDYGTHVGSSWTLRRDRVEDAAQAIAESIVRVYVVDSARIAAWKARYAGGSVHSDQEQRILESFLERAVGLEGVPAGQDGHRNSHHVQACVAEHLWYQLTLDNHDHLGQCELIVPPKWYVTAPGPDSLSIIRLPSEDLVFRLWEMKKHSPAARVRGVVREASTQMNDRGAEYVAEYVSVLLKQSGLPPELRDFIRQMPEAWDARSGEASVGVAVATDTGGYSASALEPLPEVLALFADGKRLVALVVEADVLSDFAVLVQEQVWKGL